MSRLKLERRITGRHNCVARRRLRVGQRRPSSGRLLIFPVIQVLHIGVGKSSLKPSHRICVERQIVPSDSRSKRHTRSRGMKHPIGRSTVRQKTIRNQMPRQHIDEIEVEIARWYDHSLGRVPTIRIITIVQWKARLAQPKGSYAGAWRWNGDSVQQIVTPHQGPQ